MTLNELERLFEKKFSLFPNALKKTKYSGLLEKSDSILNTDSTNAFRDRKALHLDMDHVLYLWFCEKINDFILIIDRMLF